MLFNIDRAWSSMTLSLFLRLRRVSMDLKNGRSEAGSSASMLDNILQENESKKISGMTWMWSLAFQVRMDLRGTLRNTANSLKSGSDPADKLCFSSQRTSWWLPCSFHAFCCWWHPLQLSLSASLRTRTRFWLWYVKWRLKTEYAAKRKCKLLGKL